MNAYTFTVTIISIVTFTLWVRSAWRNAQSQEALFAENALRKGCQIQLEGRDGRIRDLESTIRRVRWEGEKDCKNVHETCGQLREDLRASASWSKRNRK